MDFIWTLWWTPTAFILWFQWRERKVTKIYRAINKELDAKAEELLRTATTDAEFKKVHIYWDAKMRAMWNTSAMAIKFWKPVESYYPPEIIKELPGYQK